MNILEKLNDVSRLQTVLHDRFKLDFNPFPKSGIASINESDSIVEKLIPIDQNVTSKIITYIQDVLFTTLTKGDSLNNDKYQSLIVRGEYGSGKTQTLMFIKYLFKNIQNQGVKPYVIYIDNPGQKLSELIGGVVAQIGVENFKKYLWSVFIEYLDKHPEIKEELFSREIPREKQLFEEKINLDTKLASSVQNYKELIDALTIGLNNVEKRELVHKLKDYIINSLTPETDSPVVASYFYDIVSDTIGISKSWDMLTTGSVKELDKREVNILKAIVNIVCKQLGYTDFVILIDEFEEITAERLRKSDIDNYLRNLRLLIDREKNWCSVFAMTSKALSIIEEYSAPLAGRIKGTVIDLKPLTEEGVNQIVLNYLNTARTKDCENINNPIYPFDESGIHQMLVVNEMYTQLKGSPRFILKLCYVLLQRACEELPEGETINEIFVKKYMDEMLK